MDPRKTVRIADLDRAVRESRPIIIARPVIAVGTPERAASLTQTLVWKGGDGAKPPSSPFGERTTLNDLKAASAPTIAEELEARVNELSRPRAKVELETQEVRRLAAEVWASQPSIGVQTMARTWRDQPLDRAMVPPPQVETARRPELEPPPESELDLPSRLSTDALSPIGRIFRRLQLQRPNLSHSDVRPRRSLPIPGPRAVRIACGALTALCLAITWMSLSGKLDAHASPAPEAKPAAARASAPAARSGQQPDPAAAESVPRPQPSRPVASAPAPAPPMSPQPPAADRMPRVTSATGVTPRSAVDALMSGKHDLALQRYRALAQSSPDNPAYEAAAMILAESEAPDAEDP